MSSDSRGGYSGLDSGSGSAPGLEPALGGREEIPVANDPAGLSTGSEDSESESGSSHIGSDMPSPAAVVTCPWRTARFHDQECERFFDCPTHVVERSLSDDEGEAEDPNARDISAHMEADEAEDSGGEGPSGTNGVQDDEDMDALHPEGESSQGAPTAAARNGGGSGRQQGAQDEYDGEEDAAAASATPRMQNLPPRTSSLQGIPTPPDTERSRTLPSAPSHTPPASPSSRELPATPPPPPPPAQQSPPPTVGPRRQPTFTRLEDIINNMSEPRAPPPPPHAQIQERRANQESPAPPRDIVLPRWQPDNEVTFCPICRTQFSIFVRKHHCRKCGRVVCNSCSPHRIVIPYQFIVQPPGQPRRYPQYVAGDDFNALGGGERVRLCNPCVPDPNTTPPQTQAAYSPRSPPQGHGRSHSSSTGGGPMAAMGRMAPLFGAGAAVNNRGRSVTLAGQQYQRPGYQYYPHAQNQAAQHHGHRSREARILSGTPPAPRSDYLHASEADLRRNSGFLDLGPQAGPSTGPRTSGTSRYPGGATSSATSSTRYQIPEEDECPVCHRELPSHQLPDAEARREAHVAQCIVAHSSTGGRGAGSMNSSRTNLPESPGLESPTRRTTTGMFPYRATEKDCVDSAECTICLEEFEVGVAMARLECLCRFHRACIMAWWRGHPGRCPVHQHDGFGF